LRHFKLDATVTRGRWSGQCKEKPHSL